MADAKALQLLLSLVAPEGLWPPQNAMPPLETSLLKQVVRLAKANGLLFHVASRLEGLGHDLSFIRGARRREEQRGQSYVQTIRLLNTVEASQDIRFMLIKACTSIPHVPRDIDIFVSPADKRRLSQALGSAGLRTIYDSPAESSYAGPGYLELDIYTSIIYANKTFFDEASLWQARTFEERSGLRYPVLQAYANYPLILVHSLFGHRVLSLLDFLHLQYLGNTTEVDLSRDYAFQMGWGTVFDMAVARLDAIREDISGGEPAVSFPLLFGKDFVLECFSALESGRGRFRAAPALRLSLFIDRLVYELRKSPFYEPLERLGFPGRVATNLGLIVRKLRGDRKA